MEANDNGDIRGYEIVMDYTDVFTNLDYFPTREVLQDWVYGVAKQYNMVIVIKRSENGCGKKKPQVSLMCERGGQYRKFKGRGKQKVKQKTNDDVDEDGEEGEERKKITGTKKCGCPFLLKGFQVSPTEWQLEVKNGYHNHPVALYLDGHSYAGRLTPKEEEYVLDMSRANAPAKDVLRSLQRKNRDNHSTIRTIYNARKKHRVTEFDGRSQLQHLMSLLIDNEYVQHNRRCYETNTLLEMFFAHPTGIKLFHAFPSVLLLDCTYRTNRFRLPFLEMCGVTSTGLTFSVASVFLQAEKQDNYVWALTMLRDVLDDASLPRVIVTDRENALINAVDEKFPEATYLLCTWHIDRNVLGKCKGKFTTMEGFNPFYALWRNVMFAETEEAFADAIRLLQETYSTVLIEEEALNYVMDQWVTPYKEKFVSFWTNEVMHYENTTTNRVESHHAALKRSLGNSLGNFKTCWDRIDTLFGACHNAIRHSFEKSVLVAQHKFKPIVYKDLRGVISLYAMDKLYDEIKLIRSGKSDPLTCKHYLRKVCGLPCTHELAEYLKEGKPIPVDAVDRFWRKLDMELVVRVDVGDDCTDDMDNRFEDVISALSKRYKNMDASQKRVLLRQTVELVDPATTNMVEPEPKVKIRGRPKVKSSKKIPEASTKRDPSLFEYQQSTFDGCSVNDPVIEVPDICPTTVFTKKQHVKNESVIQNCTCSDSSNLIVKLPPQYQPYVIECKDVESDGHCGFRSVAELMNFGEDNWAKVRQDLMSELSHHLHLYERAFGDVDQVGVVQKELNCFTDITPLEHWFQLPDMAHLVATKYNRAFIILSPIMSLTFLPLRKAVPKRPKSICMAFVNRNHFIKVVLTAECPMPPVALSWKKSHLPIANGWNEAYERRQIAF